MPIFGDLLDVEEVSEAPKKKLDLSQYEQGVRSLLERMPMSAALPVSVEGDNRGEGASTIKKRFNDALSNVLQEERYASLKGYVKLNFRSATPGQLPITKLYVKWNWVDGKALENYQSLFEKEENQEENP